jgi:hypothetical protein
MTETIEASDLLLNEYLTIRRSRRDVLRIVKIVLCILDAPDPKAKAHEIIGCLSHPLPIIKPTDMVSDESGEHISANAVGDWIPEVRRIFQEIGILPR